MLILLLLLWLLLQSTAAVITITWLLGKVLYCLGVYVWCVCMYTTWKWTSPVWNNVPLFSRTRTLFTVLFFLFATDHDHDYDDALASFLVRYSTLLKTACNKQPACQTCTTFFRLHTTNLNMFSKLVDLWISPSFLPNLSLLSSFNLYSSHFVFFFPLPISQSQVIATAWSANFKALKIYRESD